MSQENYPVEFILESVESIMARRKQPKALLFDIGGVCVSESVSGLCYNYFHRPKRFK
jgi:hypothetical protein